VINWGEKLREMVENTGIPKKEISDALGITPGALSSTFASPTLKIDTIYKVCRVCKVKAYQFIASVETDIPVELFKVIELISDLDETQKRLIFEGLRANVSLAKGKTLDNRN